MELQVTTNIMLEIWGTSLQAQMVLQRFQSKTCSSGLLIDTSCCQGFVVSFVLFTLLLRKNCCCNAALKIALSAKEIDVAEWKGDILVVGVTEKDMTNDDNKRFENSLLKNLDTKLGGHLSEASSEEDFTGKPGQSMVLRVPGHGAKRIGFIGLGKFAANAYAFRNFGEAIAAAAKNAQANNVGIVLASTGSISNESKLNIASTIASGTVLGIYEDNKFKSDSNKPVLKSVDILEFSQV